MLLVESVDMVKVTSAEKKDYFVFSLSHLVVVMIILLKNLMLQKCDKNARAVFLEGAVDD